MSCGRISIPTLPGISQTLYGKSGGTVAEVGPFCGVVHELHRQGIGDSFYIASFPEQMKNIMPNRSNVRDMPTVSRS